MNKIVWIGLFLFFLNAGYAQSCCSGGVPVGSNIGFQTSDGGTFQLSLSVDFNYLHTLKSGSETLDDNLRVRTTQSYIFRGAYAISDRWTIESFLPLIRQTRRITTFSGEPDKESTFGIGDPLALVIYNIINNEAIVRVGIGPQFPLGSFSKKNNRGLTLLEDLQPGSGAWDIILFGSFEYKLRKRPSGLIYANVIQNFTGTNTESRNGLQHYKFGNDIQFITGYSDQIILFDLITAPGISIRYRHANRDQVNGVMLPGTGGDFIYTRFSNSFPFPKSDSSVNINFELPVWNKVNETQLAPSFTLNIAYFKTFESNQESVDLIDIN